MAQEEIKPKYPKVKAEHTQRGPMWEVAGLDRKPLSDFYYYLISASWSSLLALAFGGYFIINLIFAALYYFGLDGVANAQPGSFSDAFFFSVQTFSTIGFGAMSPQSPYAHFLVTIESFAGLIAVALATGLIFSKFARPTAAISFSNNMLIYNRDGVPHLHFRIANERLSEMFNLKIAVSVLIDEVTAEGHQMRRTRKLPLEIDEVALFTVNWLSMHKIDENSPLYGITADTIQERAFLFIVTIDGTESTLMQSVQASKFYRPEDAVFNHRFKDMVIFDDERGMILDHEMLNELEAMA